MELLVPDRHACSLQRVSRNDSVEFEICSRANQMPYSTDNTQAQPPTAVMGYPSKLLGRTDVAKGTMAFQLEKSSSFAFRAGQSIVRC